MLVEFINPTNFEILDKGSILWLKQVAHSKKIYNIFWSAYAYDYFPKQFHEHFVGQQILILSEPWTNN